MMQLWTFSMRDSQLFGALHSDWQFSPTKALLCNIFHFKSSNSFFCHCDFLLVWHHVTEKDWNSSIKMFYRQKLFGLSFIPFVHMWIRRWNLFFIPHLIFHGNITIELTHVRHFRVLLPKIRINSSLNIDLNSISKVYFNELLQGLRNVRFDIWVSCFTKTITIFLDWQSIDMYEILWSVWERLTTISSSVLTNKVNHVQNFLFFVTRTSEISFTQAHHK